MMEIVFLLEGASEVAMLNSLMPRILPENCIYRCIAFQGKKQLEGELLRKLRGYLNPHAKFVIMRDQDDDDCKEVKKRLVTICKQANKPDALVRIVCRELESWYLGDLDAVEKGLGITIPANKKKPKSDDKFHDPDTIKNAKEELKKLTDYNYKEVQGSRDIGLHLNPAANRSTSFQFFRSGIQRLLHEYQNSGLTA